MTTQGIFGRQKQRYTYFSSHMLSLILLYRPLGYSKRLKFFPRSFQIEKWWELFFMSLAKHDYKIWRLHETSHAKQSGCENCLLEVLYLYVFTVQVSKLSKKKKQNHKKQQNWCSSFAEETSFESKNLKRFPTIALIGEKKYIFRRVEEHS